jgi:ribonuclease VapC
VIVIDTSAVVAILTSEAEWARFEGLVLANDTILPATCLVELSMVLTGRRPTLAMRDLDVWIQDVKIVVYPITPTIAYGARLAFLRYGKGRHPAALNFGDCFSYAVARELDAPLLFKGTDFAKTDIRIAAGDAGGVQ